MRNKQIRNRDNWFPKAKTVSFGKGSQVPVCIHKFQDNAEIKNACSKWVQRVRHAQWHMLLIFLPATGDWWAWSRGRFMGCLCFKTFPLLRKAIGPEVPWEDFQACNETRLEGLLVGIKGTALHNHHRTTIGTNIFALHLQCDWFPIAVQFKSTRTTHLAFLLHHATATSVFSCYCLTGCLIKFLHSSH